MTSKAAAGENEGPIKADFEQIPVPPEGAPGDTALSADAPRTLADETAQIEFINTSDQPVTIPFTHPFRFEDREVRSVTARHMTLAEVIKVFEAAPHDPDGGVALVHFYAAMTDLPVTVIRALAANDHEALHAACYPFLPRSITGVTSK